MSIYSTDVSPDLSGLPPAEDPTPLLDAFSAAWNRRDMAGLLSCFAPDAVIRVIPPPAPPQPELYRGRGELRTWLEQHLSSAPPQRIQNVRMRGNVVTWDTITTLADGDITGVSEAVIKHGQIVDFTP